MSADPAIWFDASFGGVELLVAELDTETGRDIAVKQPSRGNGATLQDRGAKLLRATATILFIDEPGKDSYTSRFDYFRTLFMREDNADIFSHSLLGAYRARIGDVTVRVNADEEMITVTCTLLAEDEPQSVFNLGAGVSSDAGFDAVNVAAGLADTALDGMVFPGGIADVDFNTPSDLTAACVTTVSGWADTDPDDLDTNAVTSALATLSGQLNSAVNALNLTTDLSRWPAYRALINLAYQMRRAAESFTSSDANLLEITITVPTPLRVICARIYGASLSDDKAQQVAKLNRIRTPGLVPRGVYKFPSTGASA